MDDQQLQSLLKQHAGVFSPTDNGKLKCELNGHCFPARHDVIAAFINGPKFKKLVKQRQDEDYIKQLEPFLVPSINYEDKLFCALTCQLLNRNAQAAKVHMQGKRFKRAKEQFMNDEHELLQEPLLGDDDEEDEGPEQQRGAGASGQGGATEASPSDDTGEGMWVPHAAALDSDADAEAGSMDGGGSRDDAGDDAEAMDEDVAPAASRGPQAKPRVKGKGKAKGATGGGADVRAPSSMPADTGPKAAKAKRTKPPKTKRARVA